MSVQMQVGAVKFKSVRAMARAVAKRTGEDLDRVYIRLYMRKRAGKSAAKAYHAPARTYTMQVSQ